MRGDWFSFSLPPTWREFCNESRNPRKPGSLECMGGCVREEGELERRVCVRVDIRGGGLEWIFEVCQREY